MNSLRLSAIIPSANIDETKKFLIKFLNFEGIELNVENPSYAIVKTANTELHIQSATGELNEMSLYLLVDDVDQAWELLKGQQNHIEVKAPFIQDYGMKEVHLIIPHTKALLFIGEDLNVQPK